MNGSARVAVFGAVASFVVGGVGVAVAAGTPPHVDVTQPHPQLYPESAQTSGEEGTVLVDVFAALAAALESRLVAAASEGQRAGMPRGGNLLA